MGLALVIRIPSLSEAQIVVGALRSGGIDAELFDANFGRVEAPVIEGLGGYRIMAPEGQVRDARDALQLLRANPGLGEPDELGPWSASLAEHSRRRSGRIRNVVLVAAGIAAASWLVRLIAR